MAKNKSFDKENRVEIPLAEQRGPFQMGRRTMNTAIRKISTGSAPEDDPQNYITKREKRESFEPRKK